MDLNEYCSFYYTFMSLYHTMDAAATAAPIYLNVKAIAGDSTKALFPKTIHKSNFRANYLSKTTTNLFTKRTPHNSRLRAVSDVAFDPGQVEITWEIVLGALAGVIPFVVAGIEFNKRIVEQRQCKVCKGSGLVLRDNKYYFRCPSCGGFLPWQSWRRFFTG